MHRGCESLSNYKTAYSASETVALESAREGPRKKLSEVSSVSTVTLHQQCLMRSMIAIPLPLLFQIVITNMNIN